MSSLGERTVGKEQLESATAASAADAIKEAAPVFAGKLEAAGLTVHGARTILAPDDESWADFPWDDLSPVMQHSTILYHLVTSDALTFEQLVEPSFQRNVDSSGAPLNLHNRRGSIYVEAGSGTTTARVRKVFEAPGVSVLLIDAVLKPSLF
jgi:uncharacterized surface protein with fasciclin (FAS1) repeats